MTESVHATREVDLVWGCQTSRYTHRIMLLVALLFSCIILAIQFPIFIYSPDGSFHAAKILRASEGDYFTDPFTGVATIYPSLFHLFYGLINRAIEFNPIQIVQVIVVVDFFALFVAFYYCVTAFLENTEEASFCVLALPLVIYAPTSHYILIPQPSSFSFVFLLLCIGALYRYVMNLRSHHLMLGGVMGGIAVNIWWSNAFSIFAVIIVLTCHLLRNGKAPSLSDVAVFSVAFLLPCLYTVWHLYSIREILSFYLSGSPKKGQVEVADVLTTWFVTFLTKGNLPFMHHMNLWDSAETSGRTINLMAGGVKRIHAVASALHYFVLVMPFNLLLVAYSAWSLIRKGWPIHPRLGMLRTLAIGGGAVLLCSSVMLFFVDVGHLRRVHFMISVMFMLFAFTTAPALVHSDKLRRLSSFISIAALCALAYTVVYSPLLFTSSLSKYDSEIIQFMRSIEGRDHQRIFMLGEGLRRVAPYVILQSFVEAREGRYYHQDPITASKLYQDFRIMKEKSDEWKSVASKSNIKWIILKTSEMAELEVLKQYEHDGLLRHRNRDWAVLELNL